MKHIKSKEFFLNLGFPMFKSAKGKLLTKQKRSFFFSLSWWTSFRQTAQNIPAPNLKVHSLGRQLKCAGGQNGEESSKREKEDLILNINVCGVFYHVFSKSYKLIMTLSQWSKLPLTEYEVCFHSAFSFLESTFQVLLYFWVQLAVIGWFPWIFFLSFALPVLLL